MLASRRNWKEIFLRVTFHVALKNSDHSRFTMKPLQAFLHFNVSVCRVALNFNLTPESSFHKAINLLRGVTSPDNLFSSYVAYNSTNRPSRFYFIHKRYNQEMKKRNESPTLFREQVTFRWKRIRKREFRLITSSFVRTTTLPQIILYIQF